MHFKALLLLCGVVSFAAANPVKTCNASGYKQVCCDGGLLDCLVQVSGASCGNTVNCCKTNAATGAIISVVALNCLNI
ncbi:hypothetical protein BGZ96_005488, partial [Linnemannia gamsii]